jgi:hypothetical protein
VYVDRRGYADDGDQVVSQLRVLLGPEVVSSGSGEQLLFRLDWASGRIRSFARDADLDAERERLLNRPCVLCQDGFHPWPPDNSEPRRALHRATLRLVNPSSEPRRATVHLNWQQHVPTEVHVYGHALAVDRRVRPPAVRGPVAFEVTLPPGEHLLHFDATPRPFGLPRLHCAWTTTEVRLEIRD